MSTNSPYARRILRPYAFPEPRHYLATGVNTAYNNGQYAVSAARLHHLAQVLLTTLFETKYPDQAHRYYDIDGNGYHSLPSLATNFYPHRDDFLDALDTVDHAVFEQSFQTLHAEADAVQHDFETDQHTTRCKQYVEDAAYAVSVLNEIASRITDDS